MASLKERGITLNRKVLADLAVRDLAAFGRARRQAAGLMTAAPVTLVKRAPRRNRQVRFL